MPNLLARLRWFGVWLLAALSMGCAPEPTEYRLHEPIPVGRLTAEVGRLEIVARNRPHPNLVWTEPEDRAWILHVRWAGADSIAEPRERHRYVEKTLRGSFQLIDPEDDRYAALGAMTRDQFLYRTFHDRLARDWVVIFHVPDAVRELGVRIESAEPSTGAHTVGFIPPAAWR